MSKGRITVVLAIHREIERAIDAYLFFRKKDNIKFRKLNNEINILISLDHD
ncbi:hypothetical protein JCM14036_10460 [Desulfotomaculum defluvii]